MVAGFATLNYDPRARGNNHAAKLARLQPSKPHVGNNSKLKEVRVTASNAVPINFCEAAALKCQAHNKNASVPAMRGKEICPAQPFNAIRQILKNKNFLNFEGLGRSMIFIRDIVLVSKSLLGAGPQLLEHFGYAHENQCAQSHIAMDSLFPKFSCGESPFENCTLRVGSKKMLGPSEESNKKGG